MEHDDDRVQVMKDASNASFWNDEYLDDPGGPMVPDHVLTDEVAGLTPGRVLDLGCGRGDHSLRLARRGWTVHGVDWSEEAIRLAREAAAAEGLDAAFEVADITTWQPPGAFDLVVNTFALWEGDLGEATLRTARRAVAPGGTVLVLEWAQAMAEQWGFDDPDYFPTPERVVEGLSPLTIEEAGVRVLEGVLASPDDLRHTEQGDAHVVVVRARRPEDG